MSWAKPMLLMVVLGGVLYGVYVVLNKGPAPAPPPGVSQNWDKPLEIQDGTVDNGSPPQFGVAPPPPSSGPLASSASIAAGQGVVSPPPLGTGTGAPPFSSAAPGATANQNPSPDASASAPPFSSAGTSSAAPPTTNSSATPGVSITLPDATAPGQPPGETFAAALAAAKTKCGQGQLVDALRALTKWQDVANLTPEQSRQLYELLSQLAGTVVYSRQHLLAPAYKVKAGETLDAIARQCNVPTQLLAKINGIDDPNRLTPGEELKVVHGPFEAKIDMARQQLTLVVDGCYAGRFMLVGVGERAKALDGQFDVAEKQIDLSGGPTASSPIHHWVGIGNSLGIVGTSDPASIHPSGVNLSARDAEDVFDILSVGSRVTVRR